jgi:membrane protease YdiL (CAAX protease family)
VKQLKQWKWADAKSALIMMLLGALFLEIVVTKTVILIRPDMDPWRNASEINKVYMGALAILVILFWLKTPLVIRWAALKIPSPRKFAREMLQAACVSLILLLAMIGIRLWMNAHDPDAAARPWFGLYLYIHGRWFYLFSVILQEIMVKAIIQENIRLVNATGNRHVTVILTGLFFAVLHMNFQLYYLIGAGLLCMLTGYLYERDGNIWGSVLIHLTLGFMPRALGLY